MGRKSPVIDRPCDEDKRAPCGSGCRNPRVGRIRRGVVIVGSLEWRGPLLSSLVDCTGGVYSVQKRRSKFSFYAGFGHVGFCGGGQFLFPVFFLVKASCDKYYWNNEERERERDAKTTRSIRKTTSPVHPRVHTRFGKICAVQSRIVGGVTLENVLHSQ